MIYKDIKMKDVLFNNHILLSVIERFGINLGLHEKTVEEICKENNINLEVFLTILNLHINNKYKPLQIYNCDYIIAIIQYLQKSHQYYINEIYPNINYNIQLMHEANNSSEILMVENFFKEYTTEVDQHFNYENDIVFPYITNLFDRIKHKQNVDKSNNYSVNIYKEHHDDIEGKLDDLIKLLIQHIPQKNDRKIRRKILFDLFDLEQDLNIHAKIENEILIPIVERMEIKFKNR